MFKVVVKIEVLDENNQVVDHRGLPYESGKAKSGMSVPLTCTALVQDHNTIAPAHLQMNAVHAINSKLKELFQ